MEEDDEEGATAFLAGGGDGGGCETHPSCFFSGGLPSASERSLRELAAAATGGHRWHSLRDGCTTMSAILLQLLLLLLLLLM